MFCQSLEETLNLAYLVAKEKQHEFITLEHLLLALLDSPEIAALFEQKKIAISALKAEISDYLEKTTPKIDNGLHCETHPTLAFQRVLQRAIFQTQAAGGIEVDGINVLAAMFNEVDSQAVFFLNQQALSRMDVLDAVAERDSHPSSNYEPTLFNEMSPDPMLEVSAPVMPAAESQLDQYATNLNERAKLGLIDPLIDREEEVNRVVQVLCRRRKNNPLLVGEAGVGKTAIAEGLATRIVDKQVPEVLQKSVIYTVDMGGMLAGTKYRGDFEKRFKAVLKELQQIPDSIIFIDEIHTLIGAGASTGGSIDAANLLKPLLSSGEIRCMGATTYQEFRNSFEKDKALVRRFQKIDVKEPSTDEAVSILKGLRERFEAHHQVGYSEEALVAAVELSHRYIADRFLPDVAIDVIDEVGALQKTKPEKQRKKKIEKADIEEMVACMARIPSKQVTETDREHLKHLQKDLMSMVYGQDEAIETLTNAIKLARSGLNNPAKPIGSFLFAGPTGVGKTEVCLQLAKSLGVELLRFDMSEYMEKHTVSQLIGAPAGYVGFDQGGFLTDAVIKHPYAVVLLDEIEKAHPDVFNVLLQVMDHGQLTDNNGRVADFKHVILIMTSNSGAQVLQRSSVGFTEQDHSSDGLAEVGKAFSPEFRNRLDAIIQFKQLNGEAVGKVVDKFIQQLSEQLNEKGVKINISKKAREWLALHGFDKLMGARPMERLISQEIKRGLADELLFGKLREGGKARIGVEKDKLKISLDKAA